MRITLSNGKEIYFSPLLYEHLKLMAKRCKELNSDVLIIIDGKEGSGKSTLALLIADVLKKHFGFNYSPTENIEFDIDVLLKKAAEVKLNVFIWDEGALGGLSTQWFNKTQIKLLQFLMVARKKNNIYIFNIPRFQKLKEDIVLRSSALINTYENKGIYKGYYNYLGIRGLNNLFSYWKRTRQVPYYLYRKFNSKFPNVFDDLITEEEKKVYENKKDEIILRLVNDKLLTNKGKVDLEKIRLQEDYQRLKERLGTVLNVTGFTDEELVKYSKIPLGTLKEYKMYFKRLKIQREKGIIDDTLQPPSITLTTS